MTMHHTKPLQSFYIFFFFTYIALPSLSSSIESLRGGSSLSVERPDNILVSPDGTFSAGFHPIGDNAYFFAIWFNQSTIFTPVWMANRDYPVNGRRSILSLRRDGNLILRDGRRSTIWTTNTTSNSSVQLRLENTGNLILQKSQENVTLWQSFDFPTDTVLPQQLLTKSSKLISSRSRTNYSSGFYSLYFDNDNILRLLYNGPTISSVYWPDPGSVSWNVGRTTYNNSRIAIFDPLGQFHSSDDLKFISSDFGLGPKRRLTMDFDGNVRLYSLNEKNGTWAVSWQAITRSCTIHGLCGPNGVCNHAPERRCTCLPGFKVKDPTDWSQGCEPTFNLSCDTNASSFFSIAKVDYYGYDFNYTENLTLEQCKNICLQLCSCKAFMYHMDGLGRCYPKTLLLNGYRELSFSGIMYIKVPRNRTFSRENFTDGIKLKCSPKAPIELPRTYERKQENISIKYILFFVSALGGVELVFILIGCWYMFINNHDSNAIEQGYLFAATGFKKFSYDELKKATGNFSEEIGRGGAGVVYKGVLSDQRVVAIKRLEGIDQGEAEFLAEVSTIGRINHMNLIQMWGFCAEGKHRLLVYEYMEHGSLAENLFSNSLDWVKLFEIAIGTAKGLAYLHEECLEWVLHCDIKPQNILLDGDYKPKVADFGLSKLLDRRRNDRSSFSTVRGTRGYMAPEWILNLPITSKVDVYSYGIVMLEMVTGRRATGFHDLDEGGEGGGRLVPWVRDVMNGGASSEQRSIEEIMDPRIDSGYDLVKMELLVRVALQCVEEERDARPTMSQVAEMLLGHENNHEGCEGSSHEFG
ncbi:putative receptor protein kinase ZmPK1 [Magnolia sinica]|uniref:putative receptor protein kinase ZmPK1 n=1 Tax=Magnolia sinica TaxID=86752 RepID=UPI002659F824|nr:putative receptor protein kinase ZmPK1 [Magnolia sinica]